MLAGLSQAHSGGCSDMAGELGPAGPGWLHSSVPHLVLVWASGQQLGHRSLVDHMELTDKLEHAEGTEGKFSWPRHHPGLGLGHVC